MKSKQFLRFNLFLSANLNLSLRAAKYMCLRKEGEGFPFRWGVFRS